MYLTRTQIRALWLVVILIAAMLAVRVSNLWIFDGSGYDFTELDSLFVKKRDSLAAVRVPVSPEDNSNKEQTEPASIQTIQFPININTATQKELEALPRIGPKMARRILFYREENGPFSATDDLKNVKGIGEKTFEKLRPLVAVK